MYQYYKWDKNSEWWLKDVPKTSRWTEINILRFLKLYKAYSVLWDPFNLDYKNRWIRLQAYREIAKILKLKNVNENECMRLVDLLKKRYLKEKEFYWSKRGCRPIWFDIIDDIVQRILHPMIISDKLTTASFEACKSCCEKQNFIAPCCYYQTSQESSQKSRDSYQECKNCCAKQNLNAPCKYFKTLQGSSELVKSSLKKDTCTGKFKYYTVTTDEVKIVLLNFGNYFEGTKDKETESCDCNHCTNSSGESVVLHKSTKHDEELLCDCENLTDDETSASTCSCSNTIYYTPVNTLCQPSIGRDDASIQSQITLPSEGGVTQKSGLFMDSSVCARGKVISLDDDDDDMEIIGPRKHFAMCATSGTNEIYPLQVDV